MRFTCRNNYGKNTDTNSKYVIPIIANNNAKYFVVRHGCKETPMLNLHGKTEHFYIVDRSVCANDKKI